MKSRLIFCSIIIGLTVLCSIPNVTVMAQDFSNTIPMIAHKTASTSEVTPFTSDIGWKYKVINGVLYKRQYDFTRKQWIGNWIRA